MLVPVAKVSDFEFIVSDLINTVQSDPR